MVRIRPGRPRNPQKEYPAHIDPDKLPDNCHWDPSGNGRWYTSLKTTDGKRRKKRIAGPSAKLSELHDALEKVAGVETDCVAWLSTKFMESPQFKSVSNAQQDSYRYGMLIASTQETLIKDVFVSQIPLRDWDTPLVQLSIDKAALERGPSAAKKLYEFLRRLFNWAILRGLCRYANPVGKMELPKERKRRRLPPQDILGNVIAFAIERGDRPTRTKGSCPAYIWKALVIGYECRLRGVESLTLTDADMLPEGIDCARRKGSRSNIARWNQNLRITVQRAQEFRDASWKKNGRAIPLRPEHRPLLVNNEGESINPECWQSAWHRFIKLAIREGVITEDQKFGLHDMKRRGTTDTQGTRAEKLEAVGLSSLQILDVYDHSRPVVNPTSRDGMAEKR